MTRSSTHTLVRRSGRLGAAGALLLALAGGAWAQSSTPSTPWSAGISLGSPEWRDSVNGVQPKESGTSGKVWLGYSLSPQFSLEGGYMDLGKTSDPLGSARAKGLFMDAVGTWGFAPRWSVLGRAGLAHGDISSSVGDDTSLGLRAGLGLQYDLTRQVSLRGEVERNHFNDVFGKSLNTDQVTLGVGVKF